MSKASQVVECIGIRPRVAFCLSVADRVLPCLAAAPEVSRVTQAALSRAWDWVEGKPVRALALYDEHVEGLYVEGCRPMDESAAGAYNAAVAAFYYTMWHAFGCDLASRNIVQADIYNDIYDVDEDVIDEACDSALQTRHCDARWIRELAERFATDFAATKKDELGPGVLRGIANPTLNG